MILNNPSAPAEPMPADAPTPWVKALGYGGLLPFIGAAFASVMAHGAASGWLNVLLAYGAVIASFLGGVHWGIAARLGPSQARLHHTWGVVPSLLAWVALVLPSPWGLLAIAATLLACLAVDVATYPRAGWASWLPLRWQLTLVAVVCCSGAGAVALARGAALV